jgi:PTS system galactitol-specific IIB component
MQKIHKCSRLLVKLLKVSISAIFIHYISGGKTMKKVLVATGTSEHKKEFAVNYIKEYLEKKGIEAVVEGANIYEVKLEEINPDLVVTIGPHNFKTDIPIVPGTVFVTKIGMDPVCEQIIEKLNLG